MSEPKTIRQYHKYRVEVFPPAECGGTMFYVDCHKTKKYEKNCEILADDYTSYLEDIKNKETDFWYFQTIKKHLKWKKGEELYFNQRMMVDCCIMYFRLKRDEDIQKDCAYSCAVMIDKDGYLMKQYYEKDPYGKIEYYWRRPKCKFNDLIHKQNKS